MRAFCVTLYNNECIYQLSFLSSAALFSCLCLFLFSRFLAFLFALISSIVSFLFSSFFTLSLVLVSSSFSLSEEVNSTFDANLFNRFLLFLACILIFFCSG